MTITLFHGTTSNYLTEIKRDGLKPCAKPGNDAKWKFAHKWADAQRAKSVFLSPSAEIATLFAERNARLHGGQPAVVTVNLPDAAMRDLHIDEAGDGWSPLYLYHVGPIPAGEIARAEIVKPVPGVHIA